MRHRRASPAPDDCRDVVATSSRPVAGRQKTSTAANQISASVTTNNLPVTPRA